MFNKTIYMTYKKDVPDKVFNKWKELNPTYNIDFSLDNECINFLKENFNSYIVNLFKSIDKGMYKADLWRLCKLYINGGVYADIDLVPYINIDTLDKDITFYSCISTNPNSIFQAFMINFSKPKNPLILHFLISFLLNNPYTYDVGPTYDMYNCIKYNLNNIDIKSETKYNFNEVKIKIFIGRSIKNTKIINLFYFPNDISYNIKLIMINNPHPDKFIFKIKNNLLYVTRIDKKIGWGHMHSANICIQSNESIYLFKETKETKITTHINKPITNYIVMNKNNKILDSRDEEYVINKGW
jgi:hypothetical protein